MASEKINRHFIFVEAPIKLVFSEVVGWGEACWWPKECPTRFVRKSEGQIQVGSRYTMKIGKSSEWDVSVTKIVANRMIERTFHSGLFKGGRETVNTEWRANGVRIEYELQYRIKGLINNILWKFMFRRLHDRNIKSILISLKDYVEKVVRDDQVKNWESL